ncbi:MAG: SGNH/GDSL hydrolase family protein, partial [Candidatus Thorarchaeota archaeon]
MTRTRSTVLGFGDSLTAGTPGYDPEYGGDVRYQYGHWLAELARTDEHEVEFVNRGVPGDLAATMPSRLENEMTRGRYDCVIILAGTNDLGWGALPEEVLRRLSVLWDIVAAHDVPLVTCTLPPVGFLDPGLQDHRARVN